jgi:hypothetical protein
MWGKHADGCSASFSSIRASLESVRPMLSVRPICVHQRRRVDPLQLAFCLAPNQRQHIVHRVMHMQTCIRASTFVTRLSLRHLGAHLAVDAPGRRRRVPEAHRNHRHIVRGVQLQRVLHLHNRSSAQSEEAQNNQPATALHACCESDVCDDAAPAAA